jgi:hypothetical protein
MVNGKVGKVDGRVTYIGVLGIVTYRRHFEALAPFLQIDGMVVVGVTAVEERADAVLEGNKRGPQREQLMPRHFSENRKKKPPP